MKGVKDITKTINKYLEKFDAEAVIGDEFSCYVNENKVQYSLLVHEDADRYFTEFCGIINPRVKADIFLLSLFHEIFHIETIDDITDEEYNYSQDMKAKLGTSREDMFTYFRLPVEYAATVAALNYMETHANEIRRFWNELQPKIMKFYRLNHIGE